MTDIYAGNKKKLSKGSENVLPILSLVPIRDIKNHCWHLKTLLAILARSWRSVFISRGSLNERRVSQTFGISWKENRKPYQIKNGVKRTFKIMGSN